MFGFLLQPFLLLPIKKLLLKFALGIKTQKMKTIIVNVPDSDESLFNSLVKKLGFKSRIVSEEEKEEIALAKWIEDGMKSEDVSEEKVFSTLRKHGVKI
jgi:aspartokinase